MLLLSLSKRCQPAAAAQHILTAARGPPHSEPKGQMSLATCSSHGVRKTNVIFPSRSMISASSQLGQTDRWSTQRVPTGCPSTTLFCDLHPPHWTMSSPGPLHALGTQRFHDPRVSHMGTEVAQCWSCPQSLGHQGATQPLCKRSCWDPAQIRGRQLPICSCPQPHPVVTSRPCSGSAERSVVQEVSKFVTSAWKFPGF